MAVRSAVIELPVAAGVCDCPAGLRRWHLSDFYDYDKAQHVRMARCLGCDRVWAKRLNEEQGSPSEDLWDATPAQEITDG